jgi:hypothetical protein
MGVADQYQYSLAAYPWLTTEDRIVDVWIRRSGAVRDELLREWRFLHDAEGPMLEIRTPVSTSDTLKPRVYRPLDTWLKVDGTWQDSTSGLVSDTDEALLSLDGLQTVGLAWAYETLAQQGMGAEVAQYTALADRQRRLANQWKREHLPRQAGRSVHWYTDQPNYADWPLEGSLHG